ncbi:MAG: XdhC family protein, partial [Candidatus Saccharibacteria bacterium]|nr:XdhC family protein [Moraxellaceae bacterium]
MSSNQPLLKAIVNIDAEESEAVLATVVKVEGSAYRRPGARMLILANSQAVGCISGGCLEAEVCKKAAWLTRENNIVLRRYSTGENTPFSEDIYHQIDEDSDLDGARSFGLGCNGAVSVLFERVASVGIDHVMTLLKNVYSSHSAGGVAVVIAAPKNASVIIGDRLLLDPEKRIPFWCSKGIVERSLDQQNRHDLQQTMTNKKSIHKIYEIDLGKIEVFFEYVAPPHRLIVFGAGLDAQPLVRLAKQQGWHVTVVDSRAYFARHDHFPLADKVLCH